MIKQSFYLRKNSARPAVIITGSSGFLGRAIMRKLSGRYHIFALDKAEPKKTLPKSAEFYTIDLTSDENVNEVIGALKRRRGVTVASVIHLAAYYDFSGKPSDLYDQLTVQGTARLLRALQGWRVEQFMFTSTMLVHAPCEPGQKINEDWPLKPKWDYPRSKVEAEAVIRNQAGDIPTVILRIAGVYDNACHSIPISHQIQRIYENRLTSHMIPDGAAECGQSFMHRDDLVGAVAKTVAHRKQLPSKAIFLLGEPDTYSYGEIQKEVGRLVHGKADWSTRGVPKSLAKAGAWIQEKTPGIRTPFIRPWMVDIANDHFELDISRARQLLGWDPRHRLIDTLPKMVDVLKRDPGLWYKQNKLDLPGHLMKKESGQRARA